jgi:hypothetical protein
MVPVRLPEPVQEATDTAVALARVPATNPLPDAVQLTLLMAIESLPDFKSSAAVQVKVAVLAEPVLTLAVTPIVGGVEGIAGTVSGSESANVIAEVVKLRVAWALTVALMVRDWVSVAAATKLTPIKTRMALRSTMFAVFMGILLVVSWLAQLSMVLQKTRSYKRSPLV